MTTRPQYLTLDTRSEALADMTPARASILRETAALQHSLMSGWGGPPQCRAFVRLVENGASASTVASYRVPPGVTHTDVAVLMQGRGTVTLTTSVDTVGTVLRCATLASEVGANPALATWYSTQGVDDDELDARALRLVSAESWAHQNVDVTVTLDASGSDDLATWALIFRPVHVPR